MADVKGNIAFQIPMVPMDTNGWMVKDWGVKRLTFTMPWQFSTMLSEVVSESKSTQVCNFFADNSRITAKTKANATDWYWTQMGIETGRDESCHVIVCCFAAGSTGDSLFQSDAAVLSRDFHRSWWSRVQPLCRWCAPETIWDILVVFVCCNMSICCNMFWYVAICCNMLQYVVSFVVFFITWLFSPLQCAALALCLGAECKTLKLVLPTIPSWHHKSSTWILKWVNWNPESASYLRLKYRMHVWFARQPQPNPIPTSFSIEHNLPPLALHAVHYMQCGHGGISPALALKAPRGEICRLRRGQCVSVCVCEFFCRFHQSVRQGRTIQL